MRISILCSDGSPLGVSPAEIYGNGRRGIGIGGAELALLTLCEMWAMDGHEVVLYNNPLTSGFDIFEQRKISDFEINDKRDVCIIFRSPNTKGILSKGLRVWLSTDQYTQGSFRDFAPQVDKIVTISPFHTEYFKKTYGIENSIDIDLPLRVKDFDGIQTEKVPRRMIFTSVPDRGLQLLHPMWAEIKLNFPDASLVITSDYRLWGAQSPMNEKHRMSWIKAKDVIFRGAMRRLEYIEELLKAQLFIYPCTYEELFCISCSEAQYAGAFPITSTIGALQTTNMGIKVDGDVNSGMFRKKFIHNIIQLLNDEGELKRRQDGIKQMALERFHPDVILEQWNEKVFK